MIEQDVASLVREALEAARAAGDLTFDALPEFQVTPPARREHGDWSANAALVLQKSAARPPREIAETIVRHLPRRDWVLEVEVAGPGFINFSVSDAWLHDAVRAAIGEAGRYGSSDEGRGTSVNVEFVSINPTGPLHIGAARNAAIGDGIARLLEHTGWRVTREYYFNDAGRQMEMFGRSVAARYLQALGRDADVPEDGYHGDYVTALARRILDEDGDVHAALPAEELWVALRDRAYPVVIGWIEATLERFGVRFDVWFKERDLYESGRVRAVIDRLAAAGHVYEKDGAVWMAAEALGDSRDRVLVKSSGDLTYLAGDLAYHLDKAERGFRLMIDVFGADHHGQVASLTAGMRALGVRPEQLEVIIYQWVHLLRAGEPVSMSKRAGTFLTLDELLDEVGVDAARYTLLQTSSDHDIQFDVEEVKRQTPENPVYYVQYAHARIASILRKAGGPPDGSAALALLCEAAEGDLMRTIAAFPGVVSGAAQARAPYRVARYAEDLARAYHRFYTECRVISEDAELTGARLTLCAATKQVLANALSLLGVTAPERMEREDDQ